MELSDNNEKKEMEKSEPEGGLKMKVCFIFFGIGSLLAWNAILSDIGFFIHFQEKFDPSTSFAFLNFSLNIVFQFIMIFKKQLLSFKIQLLFGLVASVIIIVILPLIVVSFEKESTIGFVFTAILILFQGLVNALCCNGFFGLASFFPIEMIIALSSGQGISGILMNIITYIVLFFVNTGNEDNNNKYGAIIFFSISGFILLICLFILLFSFKSEYFRYYLGKTKDFSQSRENIENVKEALVTRSSEGENNNLAVNGTVPMNNQEVSFFQLSKMLFDIDLLSAFIYIITFALFPSCCIKQNLFGLKEYNVSYNATTIITIYNVCDTIGRSIVSKIKPTKILSYIIILSRAILLFTFLFVYYCAERLGMETVLSSILLIVNVSILALTNGAGTSLCLGIAPTLVPDELKGRAGGSVAFFNILGIFIGTCVAFLTNFIIGKIEK